MFGKVSYGKEKYGKTRFFEIPGVIPRPANEKTPNINRRVLSTPPLNRRRLRNLQFSGQGKEVIQRKPGEEVTLSAQWLIKDVSDIGAITEEAYDFIGAGYTDGAETDDPAKGEMWLEVKKQSTGDYVSIEKDGIEVLANRVHLIVHDGDNNKIEPWVRYNSPRTPGAYTFTLYASKTGGEDEAFDSWTEAIR